MQKIMITIIAFAYLVLTSGFTINVHYCMGKVDKVTLGLGSSDKCGRCGMHTKESKGCCKDEASVYKIEDNHQAEKFTFHYTPSFAIIPNNIFVPTNVLDYSSSNNEIFADNSPPPLLKDRCVLYSCYLI